MTEDLASASSMIGGEGATAQQTARIDFRHLVAMNYAGDVCTLGVWRDGAAVSGGVQVTLSNPKQLVPVHSHDVKPHYFIFGGMVFTRLTNFYLRSTYGMDWTHKAPIKLCDRSFGGVMEAEGQECVVLSKVLAWPSVNTGYCDLGNVEVLKCCGVRVHNFAHLAHLLTKSTRSPFVRLDLQWNKVVVIDRAKALEAEQDIMEQNSCMSPCYPRDLLQKDMMLPEELKAPTDEATHA